MLVEVQFSQKGEVMKTLKEEVIDSLKKGESLAQFGVRMAKEHGVYIMTPQYYKVKKELAMLIEVANMKRELEALKKKAS